MGESPLTKFTDLFQCPVVLPADTVFCFLGFSGGGFWQMFIEALLCVRSWGYSSLCPHGSTSLVEETERNREPSEEDNFRES